MDSKELHDFTVLFWNIKKKEKLCDTAIEMLVEHNADILVFAELPYIQYKLRGVLPSQYEIFDGFPDSKVRFIINKTRILIEPIRDRMKGRVALVQCVVDGINRLNIVACQLYDCQSTNAEGRYEACRDLVSYIQELESVTKNNRTLVIGDFNMNPFELGMSGVTHLNAVMCPEVAKNRSCEYEKKEYHYFFNPMWYFYGHPEHCNGTYFYVGKKKEVTRYYWHILDQVLLRPSLLSSFSIENIRIITQINKHRLLTAKRRISSKYSDHLPLCLKLTLS